MFDKRAKQDITQNELQLEKLIEEATTTIDNGKEFGAKSENCIKKGGCICRSMTSYSIDNFNVDFIQSNKQEAGAPVKVYLIFPLPPIPFYHLSTPIVFVFLKSGGLRVLDKMPGREENS